jgi:hypothetical protein
MSTKFTIPCKPLKIKTPIERIRKSQQSQTFAIASCLGGRNRFVTQFGSSGLWRYFLEIKVYALADPERAVAEVKGEGLSKSTGRMYRLDCAISACCRRQDRVPMRIFRSFVCG